jgi:hypothetical protein
LRYEKLEKPATLFLIVSAAAIAIIAAGGVRWVARHPIEASSGPKAVPGAAMTRQPNVESLHEMRSRAELTGLDPPQRERLI